MNIKYIYIQFHLMLYLLKSELDDNYNYLYNLPIMFYIILYSIIYKSRNRIRMLSNTVGELIIQFVNIDQNNRLTCPHPILFIQNCLIPQRFFRYNDICTLIRFLRKIKKQPTCLHKINGKAFK